LKTILIGNGINIQYGGKDYYSNEIVQRAIDNVKSGNFRTIDYPEIIVDHLHKLFGLAVKILEDKNYIAQKILTDEDQLALNGFCLRYDKKVLNDPTQIGFEDYFLLQRLYFNSTYDSNKGNSEERNNYFEYLRRFFLDSIYNEGDIAIIEYPQSMGEFLSSFDNIFSLNYDRNLEKVIDRPVHYLHGAFHVISEKYNNDSPMNKVMDIHSDVYGYEHLYSTALTTYCGKEKEDLLNQADKINQFLSLATKFKDECKRTKTKIFPQLKAIILAHELCPEYTYPQNYCYDIFEKINGEITLVGLSPANDDHLIRVIKESIKHITYYFYSSKDSDLEKDLVRATFDGIPITFLNVETDLWNTFK
jgi:hypothetical protein